MNVWMDKSRFDKLSLGHAVTQNHSQQEDMNPEY